MNIKRLRHLEKKLRETNFNRLRMKLDFLFINNGEPNSNDCGTLGCAIGHLPYWFKEFKFARSQIQLNGNGGFQGWKDAEEFLGLSSQEMDHLFVPWDQETSIYGGKELAGGATPLQVADNISAFIERMK